MLFPAPELDDLELGVIGSIDEVRRELQHLLMDNPWVR